MSRAPFGVVLSTLLLAVAFTAVPTAAQSPSPADGPPSATAAVVITCDAFATTTAAVAAVDVAVGSAVMVSLCSNPTTGFRWSDPVSSDPAVVSAGGWAYLGPDSDAAGAAGTELLTLVAGAVGHAIVTASYDQPWDGGQKGAWTLQLDVVVREATAVAIDCDAFAATPHAVVSMDVPAGEVVLLSVCSNATTGSSWSPATASDPAIALPGTWVFQAPATSDGTVGTAGTQWLTIAADAAGTAVISASYDQPWEGGETGAWTLELTLNVR